MSTILDSEGRTAQIHTAAAVLLEDMREVRRGNSLNTFRTFFYCEVLRSARISYPCILADCLWIGIWEKLSANVSHPVISLWEWQSSASIAEDWTLRGGHPHAPHLIGPRARSISGPFMHSIHLPNYSGHFLRGKDPYTAMTFPTSEWIPASRPEGTAKTCLARLLYDSVLLHYALL